MIYLGGNPTVYIVSDKTFIATPEFPSTWFRNLLGRRKNAIFWDVAP
jgi:hypothetical protein